MTKKEAIKIFEEKKVRTLWDDETEEWYFSVVDVVGVLTDSVDGRKYWNKLKQRLKAEGSELVTNCHQLKLPSADGKYYKTDVATTEQLFRLIQSIPSPKAEPFKLWMAQVAKERLDEMQDPELTIDRAMKEYSLPYVFHNGKKLYFKRDMLVSTEAAYRGLLIEQDERSAHRYVDSYEELKGKTLLDIGAAEAIFTLDTIEYIDHAYLFECDESWIEALEATFAPYKEKITIVRKYVSDVDDEDNIRLDTFFQGEGKSIDNLFLKMDIEGYERKALEGAVHILEHGRQIGGSVCIYHLHDDKKVIESELKNFNLKINIQPGYLYFEKEMRSAIIRFWS
ncbi:BRO-N domain-containing protein [Parabacteroides johnsonii]